MKIEIYTAFVKAGVSEAEAKAAVELISEQIDRRYCLRSAQLATRSDVESVKKDMAEMENRLLRAMNDMQRWTIGAVIASGGLFAAVSKIWH